jgi:hypothetical protein
MRVKIIKASENDCWYSEHIGEEFDVEKRDEEYIIIDYKDTIGTVYIIDKDDCEVIEEENKYIKLLKDTYLAFLRFDNALNKDEKDKEEIDVAYAWLDSCMWAIFDEVGDFITKK